MAQRPVTIPRGEAIKIAEYERDSLRARASTSGSCSHQWIAAASQADKLVRLLKVGQDDKATRAALRVGPKWKRAADCEGWPTPKKLGNSKAKDGEVNYDLFDRYTVAHFATGIGLGVARLKWWQALMFAVGWEIIETPLKRAIPGIFPYSSEDTLKNAAGDAIGMMAGWGAWRLLDRASRTSRFETAAEQKLR